jgi:hypothetical protein
MGISWKIVTAGTDVAQWESFAARGPCARFALLDENTLRILRREGGAIVKLAYSPPRLAERLAKLRFSDQTYDATEPLFEGYDVVLPSLEGDGRIRDLGLPGLKLAGDARALVDLSSRAADVKGEHATNARVAAREVEAAARFCVRYGTMLRFYY